MAWSKIANAAATSSASVAVASLTVTVGATVPIGSLVVVAAYDIESNLNVSPFDGPVTDSVGNTYTQILSEDLAGNGSNGAVAAYFSILTIALTSTSTIKYTPTTGNAPTGIGIQFSAWSGGATSSITDIAVGTNTSAANFGPLSSGTPVESGELMIGIAASKSGTTYSHDSFDGWTSLSTFTGNIDNLAQVFATEFQIDSGTSALTFNPTVSPTTSARNAQIIVSFKTGAPAPDATTITTNLKSITQTNDATEVFPAAITTQLKSITLGNAVTEVIPTAITTKLKSISQTLENIEKMQGVIGQNLHSITQTVEVLESNTSSISTTLPSMTQEALAFLEQGVLAATTTQLQILSQQIEVVEAIPTHIAMTFPAPIGQEAIVVTENFVTHITMTLKGIGQTLDAVQVFDSSITTTLHGFGEVADVEEIIIAHISMSLPTFINQTPVKSFIPALTQDYYGYWR